ncbi:hypothetical protein GCM10011586_28700 [Silvibacterium dinghuense]|nr:hypothetical protein GCM10011586_28700 [Silvibacterium dinghuense]
MHRINTDASERGVFGGAALEIEGPGMPRADDVAILDDALTKRTATMRTDVVDSVDFTIRVGDAQCAGAANGFASLSFGRELGAAENSDRLRHA